MNTDEQLEDLRHWQVEATDLLRRLIDRINAIEIRLGDLSSRVDEWDIRP